MMDDEIIADNEKIQEYLNRYEKMSLAEIIADIRKTDDKLFWLRVDKMICEAVLRARENREKHSK
jgi:Mg/Co/Ni transporter MgtE